jgi:RNA polymerase sigma factor (sigma-70 family)
MNTPPVLTLDNISDNEIIARILAGDKNLYARVIKKYNQRLYRVAMSIINDDAEAEDIMQVTYIKTYEHLGDFAFKASFSTWLTKILINECLLRLKLKKRYITMNDEAMDHELYLLKINEVTTPAAKLMNTELKNILEESIRQLPEKYRTVFVMREIEGLNVADTQDCLAISEANVKVRLSRARVLLKNKLSEFYKKEDILHFHLTRCDRMVLRIMGKI